MCRVGVWPTRFFFKKTDSKMKKRDQGPVEEEESEGVPGG